MDHPRLIIKQITDDMDGWDVTQGQCANCRVRVGAHSLRETWKCGLMTKEEYIKISKEDKKREKAKNPSTPVA